MNCPSCKDAVLQMSERSGIEIDYCPTCRGVWLDRGELDKIIEKSNQASSSTVTAAQQPTPPQNFASNPSYHHNHSHDYDKYKYKRKKSFLEEIFD